jgi:hypothetical protein
MKTKLPRLVVKPPGALVSVVMFETPKVAVSEMVLGMFAGVQFEAVNQVPLVGFRFQVALPDAREEAERHKKDAATAARKGWEYFMPSVCRT